MRLLKQVVERIILAFFSIFKDLTLLWSLFGNSSFLGAYCNSMLVPNKMQHVICTGNIGREQYNELCGLAPTVTVVKGDFDDDETMPFPEVAVVQVGQFRIGVMHGHQLLPLGSQDAKARMRRKMNVDVFVSGHTHQNEVVLQDGYYHINPVSLIYLGLLLYLNGFRVL